MKEKEALSKKELQAQVLVALDAFEADDPRAPKLLRPILTNVSMHAIREGRKDYEDRADDVATGQALPEWAWPLDDADDAYLGAVGSDQILKEIGVPANMRDRLWEHVADTWLKAFRGAYVTAHDEGATARKPKKKTAAQLDREIAEALGARPPR